MGDVITILLGIIGAVIGGVVGRGLAIYQAGEPAGWVMSILGAVVILFGYRRIVASRCWPADHSRVRRSKRDRRPRSATAPVAL